MNLLERCQTANAKIAALVEAKKSKEIADNIRKRATDLQNASETMNDYSGRANVLLDAGILKPNELADSLNWHINLPRCGKNSAKIRQQ